MGRFVGMGIFASLITGILGGPGDASSGPEGRAYPVALVANQQLVLVAADEEELRWQAYLAGPEAVFPDGSLIVDAQGQSFRIADLRVDVPAPGMLERLAKGLVNLPLAARLAFRLVPLPGVIPLQQMEQWLSPDAAAVRRQLAAGRYASPGDLYTAWRLWHWKELHHDRDHRDVLPETSVQLVDAGGRNTVVLRARWIDGVTVSSGALRLSIAAIYRHQVAWALRRASGRQATLLVAGAGMGGCPLPAELDQDRLVLRIPKPNEAAAAIRPLLTKP